MKMTIEATPQEVTELLNTISNKEKPEETIADLAAKLAKRRNNFY